MKMKISALLLAVLIVLTACSKEPVQEESDVQSESASTESVSEVSSDALDGYFIPFPVFGWEDHAHTKDFAFEESQEYITKLPLGNNAPLRNISLSLPKTAEIKTYGGIKKAVLSENCVLELTLMRISEVKDYGEDYDYLKNYKNPEDIYAYVSHERALCGDVDCLRIIQRSTFEDNYDYTVIYYTPINEKEVFSMEFALKEGYGTEDFILQEKVVASLDFAPDIKEDPKPELDGKPCKYNTIPGYEVDTSEIAAYWIGSRAVGGSTGFKKPEEIAVITELLEKLVVYNTQESQEVFEDQTLGSWFSLEAVDENGNVIFEWGFAPFSIIIRYGEYYNENIPYKTENGEEIWNEIFKIYDERNTRNWWALSVYTLMAEPVDGGRIKTRELYNEEYPDIPEYTAIYWDPIEGYEKTSPYRNQPETSYGFRYTDGKQVISQTYAVISPEADLVEYHSTFEPIGVMFQGKTNSGKYDYSYEVFPEGGDWYINYPGEEREPVGYFGYRIETTVKFNEELFLQFNYNFEDPEGIFSFNELPQKVISELETVINSLYVD